MHFAQRSILIDLQLHLCMQLYDGFYVTPRRRIPLPRTIARKPGRARRSDVTSGWNPAKTKRLQESDAPLISLSVVTSPHFFYEISILFI